VIEPASRWAKALVVAIMMAAARIHFFHMHKQIYIRQNVRCKNRKKTIRGKHITEKSMPIQCK
jgi:hypothetical protein